MSAQEARSRLGLPAAGRLLCALGFIRSYKGYGLLAESGNCSAGGASVTVMGELMAEEEQPVVDRLGASDQVIFGSGMPGRGTRLRCATDALLLPYEEASDSGRFTLPSGRVPVIYSDAPQLAASVSATGAGIIVPRNAGAWAAAVTAPLPSPPTMPPPNVEIGAKHLDVYAQAIRARRSARRLRFVFYSDATELGGAEQVLADLLTELDPEIDIVLMGVSRAVVDWLAAKRPGCRTCVAPPVRDKLDVAPFLAHWRASRKLQPDVFQANLRHPWSCQFGLAAAILTPGVKVVAVEHLPTSPTAELQRRLKRLTSSRLDAHVAVGHRSARELETLIGLPPETIAVIHNGVHADGTVARRREPGQQPTVGAMGRLSAQKGFDVLLRALAQLPDVDAVIAGDGPEQEPLERLRDELGLRERVRLIGPTKGPSAVWFDRRLRVAIAL